jgi:hypothetical protein
MNTNTPRIFWRTRSHRAASGVLGAAAAIVTVVASLVAVTPRAQAIQGGTEVASTERALEAVGQFSRTQWLDLPGALGNAILIAPDRVLLPRHLINNQFTFSQSPDAPAEQFIVRFRRLPDGTLANPEDPSSYFTVGVRGFIFLKDRDPGADAVVAILSTTVRHIQPIEVDPERRILPNTRVQVVSWGQQQAGIQTPADSRAQPARLRRGEIIIGDWDRRQLELDTSTTARNLATVVDSDSGAGLFFSSGGRLRLIGIVTRQSGGVSIALLRRQPAFFPGKAAYGPSVSATPYNRSNPVPPPPPATPVVNPSRPVNTQPSTRTPPRGVFRLTVR